MTPDQIDLYDQYTHLIELAVAAESDVTAAQSTIQIQSALAKDYRAQAKAIAAQLGITP